MHYSDTRTLGFTVNICTVCSVCANLEVKVYVLIIITISGVTASSYHA